MPDGGDITFTFGIAAVVAAIVSYLTARLAGYSKDVIEERSKWREKIRDCAKEAAALRYCGNEGCNQRSSTFAKINAELRTRLNPLDEEDLCILDCLAQLEEEENSGKLDEFLKRVSLLLKHDWERAKWEASVIRNPFFPPRRIRYVHYRSLETRRQNV